MLALPGANRLRCTPIVRLLSAGEPGREFCLACVQDLHSRSVLREARFVLLLDEVLVAFAR